MKKQIRKSVFETNSSSTHAICITKDNNYKKRDYIEFEFGEFGWEFNIHENIHAKASYLITAIFSANKDVADANLIKLKAILDRNNIEYEIPKPLVNCYHYNGTAKYYYDNDGYIDHGGETVDFVNAVLSDDDTFLRYMFGHSFIVTGNDNDNEPFDDYMYEDLGYVHTSYGDYKKYGKLKPEFDNYNIFKKGN